MLVELTVENVALIQRAQIAFGTGFTVLTGETGAGKSLLVDSIQLVLGERADSELVRVGASRAVVSAVFDLSGRTELIERVSEMGLAMEEGLLYVQREIAAEGRSSARIGGKLVPVGVLRDLGRWLVDLHGQHDHQALLDPRHHVEFLDAWIGAPALQARSALIEAWRTHQEATRRLERFRAQTKERIQRLDLLRYQIAEIEREAPLPGELAELENKLGRLKHVERLGEATRTALTRLDEEESSVLAGLGESVRVLESALRLDPELAAPLNLLKEALIAAEEGVRGLQTYRDQLEEDPAVLDTLLDRQDRVRRLARKYAEGVGAEDPIRAMLGFLESAKAEVEELAEGDQHEADLGRFAEQADLNLRQAAQALTVLRQEQARVFATDVLKHLRELAMERADFEVRIRPKPTDGDGSDEIEFLFSANPGEGLRPLAKIASGGEISRVMLAIRAASAGRAGVPTMIFDEVDAGLSGRTAAIVARKIDEIARHVQLIAISHLPQIAAKAVSHYRIQKQQRDDRVLTEIDKLSEIQRVDEVARLLAGELLTETARQNARELLAG